MSDENQTKSGTEKILLLDLKNLLQRSSVPVSPGEHYQFTAFYRFVRQNLTQKVLDQGSINDPGDFVEDFLSMVCVTKACTRFEYNYAVKSKGSTLT